MTSAVLIRFLISVARKLNRPKGFFSSISTHTHTQTTFQGTAPMTDAEHVHPPRHVGFFFSSFSNKYIKSVNPIGQSIRVE